MTKGLYITSYPVGMMSYAMGIYADNIDHARELAKIRNIGEHVSSNIQKSIKNSNIKGMPFLFRNWVKTGKICKSNILLLAHEASILGFIAMKSGVASPEDTIGDKGLVHEIIHMTYPSLFYHKI